MKSATLARLHRVLGVVRAAEAAQLGAVMSRIASHLDQAALLRAKIDSPRDPEPASPATGPDIPVQTAADLAIAAGWRLRLAEMARAEDALATALEPQADGLRQRLARSHGRESVVKALAERARIGERRLAAARAEANAIRSRSPADQSDSSGSTPAVSMLAGSPGIA